MLNYIRKLIYKKQNLARQSWEPKNSIYRSNIFKELNLEYRNYGNKNKDKFFYVIRNSPGAGFFSNLNFVIHNLLISDSLKMIPVIDMENYQTYYNCKIKINGTLNAWDYYFEPVSRFTLKEVYKSKNVIICDKRTRPGLHGFSIKDNLSNFKYFNGFQFLDARHKKITKKYIRIKQDILKEVKIIQNSFKNKKILGVCFRGADQKTLAYHPHTPTEEQMLFATNLLIKKHKFDKIYLCTEEIDNLNFYKKKFGKMLSYYDCPRTTDKVDLFNNKIDNKNKKHRYIVGRGNLIDMLVLSKTDHLLFALSNIPAAAIFFSSKKLPGSIIDNGLKGNIFASQFSWYVRKRLPVFLGGFKNEVKNINSR